MANLRSEFCQRIQEFQSDDWNSAHKSSLSIPIHFSFFMQCEKFKQNFAKSAYCKSLRQKPAWVHIAKKMRVRKQNPFHLEISQKERLIEQLDALSDTFFSVLPLLGSGAPELNFPRQVHGFFSFLTTF